MYKRQDLMNADTLIEYLVEEKGYTKISMVNVNTEGGQSAGDRVEEVLADKDVYKRQSSG